MNKRILVSFGGIAVVVACLFGVGIVRQNIVEWKRLDERARSLSARKKIEEKFVEVLKLKDLRKKKEASIVSEEILTTLSENRIDDVTMAAILYSFTLHLDVARLQKGWKDNLNRLHKATDVVGVLDEAISKLRHNTDNCKESIVNPIWNEKTLDVLDMLSTLYFKSKIKYCPQNPFLRPDMYYRISECWLNAGKPREALEYSRMIESTDEEIDFVKKMLLSTQEENVSLSAVIKSRMADLEKDLKDKDLQYKKKMRKELADAIYCGEGYCPVLEDRVERLSVLKKKYETAGEEGVSSWIERRIAFLKKEKETLSDEDLCVGEYVVNGESHFI